MDEGGKRIRRHRIVMLENGMKPDDRHLRWIESTGNALSLGNAGLYAARAKHLEGVKHNDPPAQIAKRQRTIAVEPLRNLPFRGGLERGIVHGAGLATAEECEECEHTSDGDTECHQHDTGDTQDVGYWVIPMAR
ncbi:hypothetical protein GGR19_003076 [Croceicoccus naphthovorans]|nr:hypothetical protein [Croceicoccus naphthovorans]